MMDLLEKTKQHVKEKLPVDATGHDWLHCERVCALARQIAESEPGANLLHVELAAWMHDLHDWKFQSGSESAGREAVRTWLVERGATTELATAVSETIEEVSFKGAQVPTVPTSREGKIVQDADRLEALGAIGIARCFAYGGYKRQALLDPDLAPQQHDSFTSYQTSRSTSLNHFYEKLLLLRDRMHTPAGRQMAEQRHEFQLLFLRQLQSETGFSIQTHANEKPCI